MPPQALLCSSSPVPIFERGILPHIVDRQVLCAAVSVLAYLCTGIGTTENSSGENKVIRIHMAASKDFNRNLSKILGPWGSPHSLSMQPPLGITLKWILSLGTALEQQEIVNQKGWLSGPRWKFSKCLQYGSMHRSCFALELRAQT